MNFHDLGLNPAILRTLEDLGHTTPTPIQEQAIPPVLEGRDVVGLAQTGTGKTAAFMLPLLQRQINDDHKGKFRPIRVLVLTPTRELAAQIFEKAKEYGRSLNLRSELAVGGVPINRQQKKLSRGTDILIATPGRLLDLYKRGAVKFDKVQTLVLDEADHMMDIGFLPDIRRIIGHLPTTRQTLLFSATMPKPILELAEDYLSDAVQISVARESTVAENIEQLVIHMPAQKKPDALADLLYEHRDKRVVVFARTKHGSDKIVKRLQILDIKSLAIHGNKSQSQRERALKAFTKGECNVLIATDIAARGIDIKDIGLVVNYELPQVPEVYVHRIGRTARAGTSGLTVAFCAPDETKHLRAIEKLIKMALPFEGERAEIAAKKPKDKRKKRSDRGGKPERSRFAGAPKSDARKRKPKKEFEARDEAATHSEDHFKSDKPREDRPRRDKSRRDGPREDRPRRDKPRNDRSYEDRPRRDRPRGDESRDDRPRRDRSHDDRSRSDKPRFDKPRRDKPYKDKSDEHHSNRERASEDRFSSDKPKNKFKKNRPFRERSDDNRSNSDRPRFDKPKGDKPRGDKPRYDKPKGDQPRGDKARSDKPRGDKPKQYKSKSSSSKPRKPAHRKGSGGFKPKFRSAAKSQA